MATVTVPSIAGARELATSHPYARSVSDAVHADAERAITLVAHDRPLPMPERDHVPLSTIPIPIPIPMLPPLFAFGWLSPAMLGWLAAAAAPLLIHLLSRRRYRETSWAAMEYLLAAMRQQRRRIRFEQWLLLAVRTLLVVLVVLAVAEPYLESAGLAFAPGGRVHRVLVFDGSYSMAYKPADKTRFDRAKELARRIVEESSEGDAFTLVLMSSLAAGGRGHGRLEPRRDPPGDRQPPASARGGRSAGRRGRGRGGWSRASAGRIPAWCGTKSISSPTCSGSPGRRNSPRRPGPSSCGRPTSWPKRPSLLVIDVGQPAAENLAVTALQAADPPVTVGRDVSLVVRLQDFGRQTARRSAGRVVRRWPADRAEGG